ncbi:phage holin family protein [Corallococcus sp. AB049A]|uniref:Phage holin family protein n=1 Tax=Corallococcus interemptor TaxID=2316720 RepID=A0A3A8R3W5_9BACT|nr:MULTISPECIES: phage holin family protein [Corallococcus]RKH47629.1 phage holin family protein [Corallococcus sp. AB050B]RKH73505.1 phage holin family protein [Corallococcus interemptor]RKI56295.1 phage holin family protein [Corallococcus sp. AB049A]
MDLESERLERSQLETLSTPELIRHALSETRLLVKAEVMHAKKELKQELQAARLAGIFLGAGAVLALTSLSVLFVALGLALPLGEAVGVLIVGAVLLAVAGLLLFLGTKRIPKKPLVHTQERLKTDLQMTRETLQ